MSWNPQGLVDDAISSSTRAVQFDNSGQCDAAAYYYREAARFLLLAANAGGDEEQTQSSWKDRAKEYLDRAAALDQLSMHNYVLCFFYLILNRNSPIESSLFCCIIIVIFFQKLLLLSRLFSQKNNVAFRELVSSFTRHWMQMKQERKQMQWKCI